MKKILVFSLLLLAVAGTAQAMAITDSINPQNCNRSDATCASFLDTSSNGQIKWGGLVAGGLRSLTNLFTDGKVGIGTLRPNSGEQALRLDVNGAVGAKFYCDENGNHCVAGDQLGAGGGPTVGFLLTGNNGIVVNRNSTTGAYVISTDGTMIQKRVSGFCDVGQAIKKVNQDGTVECQTVTGTGNADSFWGAKGSDISNLNSGNVGVGTQSPVGKLHVVASGNNVITAETTGQFAYINLKDKNGTAEISNNGGVLVLGGNAAAPIVFRNNKYQTRMVINSNGNVGIGTDNPQSSLEVSGKGTGTPVAKFIDSQYGNFASLGINGTGAEFFGSQGVYAHSESQDGVGITGFVYKAGTDLGETYGGRFISPKVGSFNRGSIGIYATNSATDRSDGNKIPAKLLNDPKSYAGYFDGNVNVNGDMNVNGKVMVNGQPIGNNNPAPTPAPKIGEYCGAYTHGDAVVDTNIPCNGQNIYKGGDMTKSSNFSCPAKYTLVGGDFQSPGNRYFYACVRSAI